jgi:hypothetical protein
MATSKKQKMTLIASPEKNPAVALKPGQRLQVTTVTIQGADLENIKKAGARLCGGSGTCLALVDIGADVINPA